MQRLIRVVPMATLALMATACAAVGSAGSTPGTTTSATRPATASPTVASTVLPKPTPSTDPVVPGGLEIGRIAEVVTTDLVVRSLPEISDASVIDPVRMPFGYLAYIVDGPVSADGYSWYLVAPFPPHTSDVVESHPKIGWLAATGKDGEPWIAPWEGECLERDWDGMMLSLRYVPLVCWGRSDVTLEGMLRCGESSQPGGEPIWLWTIPCRLEGPDYGELLAGGVGLHFAPGMVGVPADGVRVRVTGHLDDPAAESCSLEPVSGFEPPADLAHPELVKLACREAFVVTEVAQL